MYTLLHRRFTIACDFSKFHFEVETLKKTLHKNAYPAKFVDKCISKFVYNIFVQKSVVTTVPKLELRIVLPYLGNILLSLLQLLSLLILLESSSEIFELWLAVL